MSSKQSDPKIPQPSHADERAELAQFAVTLGEYLTKLMDAGFKRGEAQQLVLQYQELRFLPVPMTVAPEEPS